MCFLDPRAWSAAEVVFWCAFLLLLYTYIGYPLLLLVISLFRNRRRAPAGYTPRLSVIIPCYNEEASIETKVRETLALQYPPEKLEIIVVSDGSTDATDEIVRRFTDHRVILLRVNDRRGKTHAQNVAVEAASGDIVVFSDATTAYHRDALLYLAANFQKSEVAAVSGRYNYVRVEALTPTDSGSMLFWGYENIIKNLQSRISTLTGCSGCIYSVRRALYQPLEDNACSDLVEPLRLVQLGHRVLFEPRAVAYEEVTTSGADEFRMRIRVAAQGIQSVLQMGDLLRVWKYGWISFQLFSHKLLRWLAPVMLAAMFISAAALAGQAVYRNIFFVQAGLYLYALVSTFIPFHRLWRPLGIPLYFCIINGAVLVSCLHIWRGREFVTWETVRRKE